MTDEVETSVFRVWYSYHGEDFIDVEAMDGAEAIDLAHEQARNEIDEILDVGLVSFG